MDNIYNQTIKLFGSHPEPAFESETGQVETWAGAGDATTMSVRSGSA